MLTEGADRGPVQSATMERIRTSSGVAVAFDVHGAGAPMVLVHGITENRHTWDPLVDDLATDHHVVRVDLRGHGESDREPPYDLLTLASDVHEVCTASGIGRDAILVGHSLGGTVATAYAASFPCRAVVNVDQPLDLGGFQTALQEMAPMLRGDRESCAEAVEMVLDAMRGQLAGDELARIESLRRTDQDVVLGVWDPVIDTPRDELDTMVRTLASAVAVPYLSLHGIDPGAQYPSFLMGLVPGAVVEIWPEHGHYPHLVDPARFLARLRSFEATLP